MHMNKNFSFNSVLYILASLLSRYGPVAKVSQHFPWLEVAVGTASTARLSQDLPPAGQSLSHTQPKCVRGTDTPRLSRKPDISWRWREPCVLLRDICEAVPQMVWQDFSGRSPSAG